MGYFEHKDCMCVCVRVNGDNGAHVFRTENESQEERKDFPGSHADQRQVKSQACQPSSQHAVLGTLYRGQGCETQDLGNLQLF